MSLALNPDRKFPTLHMTVGLPYSGKSTWAREQNMPIVCPDSIRIALHGHRYLAEAEPMVWVIARIMVKALFDAGHNHVILDATNTTKQRRDEWRNKQWRRRFHVTRTPYSVCVERAKAVSDDYILNILASMYEKFEELTTEEGERTLEVLSEDWCENIPFCPPLRAKSYCPRCGAPVYNVELKPGETCHECHTDHRPDPQPSWKGR